MSRAKFSIPMISDKVKSGDPFNRHAVRIDDSLAETDRTNQDFSLEKERRVVLNGTSQSSDGSNSNDLGLNSDSALRDSKTGTIENPDLKFKFDPRGSQSLHKRVKHNKRKHSSDVDERLHKMNMEEMLQQLANELIRENSKLRKELVLFSEKCLDLSEENNSIMDELEKKCSLDEISDLRAKNPATAEGGSNSEGERAEGANDSTADQKKDVPKFEFDLNLEATES